LISDKETEKSAAALNVNVGALEDPKDVRFIIYIFIIIIIIIIIIYHIN